MPERIAAVLSILAILINYGRHLADAIEHRAVWRGFATIAQFFGTATVPVILAHIQRGIMRAVALERMLRRRAARGRDLAILARRSRARRAAAPTAAPEEPTGSQAAPATPDAAAPPANPATAEAAGPPAAEAPPAQQKAARPVRHGGPEEPLTLDTLPSMAHFEAEALRRPVGQTIVAICRDFGISPSLCNGTFWNQVFMAIHWYRGSVGNVVLEMGRREKRFDKDHWKHPDLPLPEQTREGVRRVLGFLIGDPSVDPLRPEPAPDAPAAVAAPVAVGAPVAVAAPEVPVAAEATGPP